MSFLLKDLMTESTVLWDAIMHQFGAPSNESILAKKLGTYWRMAKHSDCLIHSIVCTNEPITDEDKKIHNLVTKLFDAIYTMDYDECSDALEKLFGPVNRNSTLINILSWEWGSESNQHLFGVVETGHINMKVSSGETVRVPVYDSGRKLVYEDLGMIDPNRKY